MASCAHKSGRCKCSAPASVTVSGHWREVKPRRKKRTPAKPTGPYYVAESSNGQTCPHHHRTRSGARRCANAMQKKSRAAHARLTRKQAKATRMVRWDVDRVTA